LRLRRALDGDINPIVLSGQDLFVSFVKFVVEILLFSAPSIPEYLHLASRGFPPGSARPERREAGEGAGAPGACLQDYGYGQGRGEILATESRICALFEGSVRDDG